MMFLGCLLCTMAFKLYILDFAVVVDDDILIASGKKKFAWAFSIFFFVPVQKPFSLI